MNWAAVAIGVLALALLGISGYLYLSHETPLTLSFRMSIDPQSAPPGGNIQATFTVTTSRAAAVELNYTLVSRTGQNILTQKQSFLVEGETSRTLSLSIPPGTEPGAYWLRARAASGEAYSVAIAGLAVVAPQAKSHVMASKAPAKPAPIEQKPNQTETKKPEAPPQYQEPPEVVQEPEQPTRPEPLPDTPGPAPLSTDEIIAKAKDQAASNPTDAADSCQKLEASDIDTCLSEAALAAWFGTAAQQAGSVCLRIKDSPSKDACLANLALSGDFSICDSITNADIRDSCNALKGRGP